MRANKFQIYFTIKNFLDCLKFHLKILIFVNNIQFGDFCFFFSIEKAAGVCINVHVAVSEYSRTELAAILYVMRRAATLPELLDAWRCTMLRYLLLSIIPNEKSCTMLYIFKLY